MTSINTPQQLDDLVVNHFVNSGELDENQRQQTEATANELECTKVVAISRLAFIGDDRLYRTIADALSWPFIDKIQQCPSAQTVLDGAKSLGLNIDWCINHSIYPVLSNDELNIFTDSPTDFANLRLIASSVTSTTLHYHLLTPAMASSIEDDITRERAVSELFGTATTDMAALAEEAPVINLVNNIVERAIFAEASDIHIEQGLVKMMVRFRVDGKLVEFMQQPASRFAAIASRIKLLSNLDIAERRLPQDGRFTTRAGKLEYDVRVSTAPDVHGESIVMRLLPKKRDELSLGSLGFEPDHLALIRDWGKLSNGIVLVTGPTGSGKSTTLYGLLSDIKTGEEKIVTVEDPVEYQLEGITQVQARADIGYTFARALRTFLRQDPDVIMVGEIRDKETADIAVQSSLTGHLVLSTLHTNDASSVFPRLSDIGVAPYLTAATIQGVQAQRLVRKVCPHCAIPAEEPDFLTRGHTFTNALHNLSNKQWKKAVGCSECHGKGYKGRVGIYELIPVTAELRSLIASSGNVTDIRQAARAAGFRSLTEDGLIKAAKGITTVDEVLRVCALEESEL